MIRCRPPAVCEGRRLAEPDVRPCPGCETALLLNDRWSTFDGNLFEPRLALPTAHDIGLASGSHVFHSLALSEHRHETLLALVFGYDKSESVGTTSPPPFTSSPTCLRGGSPRDAHTAQKRENALPRAVALLLL